MHADGVGAGRARGRRIGRSIEDEEEEEDVLLRRSNLARAPCVGEGDRAEEEEEELVLRNLEEEEDDDDFFSVIL